jgi:hypothetical protein
MMLSLSKGQHKLYERPELVPYINLIEEFKPPIRFQSSVCPYLLILSPRYPGYSSYLFHYILIFQLHPVSATIV